MSVGYVRPNSLRAWLLAARPKTLSAASLPVMVGSALAYAHGHFAWLPCVICFLFAFLMQIDANFINDYFDYVKGSDRADRLGPERACAQGWIGLRPMQRGIVLTTLVACAVGSVLIAYGGWAMVGVGMICVVFAFLYTAGPYPLAYHGWGDALVLLFFGFVPVCGTYYVMSLHLRPSVWLFALGCGLVIDTLLLVNNYRDREQDAAAGKRTLVVRVGEQTGGRSYLWAGVAGALCPLAAWPDLRSAWLMLPLAYLLPHVLTWRRMLRIRQGRALNRILAETSRNMLCYGLLVVLGLLLAAG